LDLCGRVQVLLDNDSHFSLQLTYRIFRGLTNALLATRHGNDGRGRHENLYMLEM
jgi:hypothetical protein